MSDLAHPPWCDLVWCEASSRADGAHRTEPFGLDLSTVQATWLAGPVTAWLEQPVVAAGAATPLLVIQFGEGDRSRVARVPLGLLREMQTRMDRLAGLADDYTREPEAAAKPVPSYVEGRAHVRRSDRWARVGAGRG